MENQVKVTAAHRDHNEWIGYLKFCKDEISSFENRLSEVVTANNKREIVAQVEHFQNQFIREKEVIDILKHDIRAMENQLEVQVAANPVATEHKRVADEPELRERMDTFEKLFNELKEEFHGFIRVTL
ncbi:MAG: hypothetical protein WC760_05725 [Bacteroidia bacterium]|jgi:hypothetical protein